MPKRKRPVAKEVVQIRKHSMNENMSCDRATLIIPVAVVKKDAMLAELRYYHADDGVSAKLWNWLTEMEVQFNRSERLDNALDEDTEWSRYSFDITFGPDGRKEEEAEEKRRRSKPIDWDGIWMRGRWASYVG
jgi:hypothetical protein